MPGRLFNGKKYYPVPGMAFYKKGLAEDQATRIRRSGYYVRVFEDEGRYALYARTKNGRPIPTEWRKVGRRDLAWKR